MALSGQQRKKLQEALVDAFPTMASLEQMVLHELSRNLRAIAGEGNLQDVVFKLIQTADAQGWLEDLICAACDINLGNLKLQDIAKELLPNPETKAHPVSLASNPPKETKQLQKILFLVAVVALTLGNISQGQIALFKKASPTYAKTPVQAEGLIAYYPFNGNASDQSGNEHNGEVIGAMLTRDRFGYANKAYRFDGKGSFIDLGTLEWYKNDSWTMVAWVETDSASNQMIMSHGTGWNGNGAYVNVFNGRLYITTNTSQVFDNKTFPLGSWHMVAAVKDKEDLKLYRDATRVGLGQSSNILPPSGLTFQVGRHYDGIQNWQGSIDDIRIYNRALNKEEIEELYHEGGWK